MTERDFSLLAAQIRAARALLGWSQAYLAAGCKMHRSTLADLEAAKREPHEGTLFVLMNELANAGIEFTETGVQFRKWPPKSYVPRGISQKSGDNVDWYALAKDFAAPLATVSAAGAAVCVTYYFNRRQVEVSASQRDIALDKLKFDAFGKRYEIYSQAKELLSYVSNLHDFEKIDSMKIRDLRVKIDEARFFFGPSLRTFLNEIDREAEALLENLGQRYSWEADSDDKLWRSINEELAKNSAALRAYYAEMPSRFEGALQLSQLARD